jgi:hypothetical protein
VSPLSSLRTSVETGHKKQKTRWAVAPAGDENSVLANRYAHLIKRGAVP